jgi:hypothetical protein
MKKTITITLIGLLISITAFAQSDVMEILKSKDFATLKQYAENSEVKQEANTHWGYLRQLTDEYYEGILFVEQSIPDPNDTEKGTILSLRINLISTNTEIIYYELSEKRFRNVGGKENAWQAYYFIVEQYKNEAAFENLKTSFKNTYNTGLNEKELFMTDIVFGEACTIAGINPEGRQQIDKYVTKKNKKALAKLLVSTNTEKQIYALDGLAQLKAKGVKLTDEELKIMNYVKNKSGDIRTYTGCVSSNREIRKITAGFGL